MAFTMTIGGTDVIPYLDLDTLAIEPTLNARWTVQARLEDPTGAYRPALLQEVVIQDDGNPVFTGIVVDAAEEDFAAEQGIATSLTAADYSARLEHVYLSLTTDDGDTLRDVVDAVFTAADLTADFGLTRDAGMAAGATLEAQTFTDATVAEIFNHLSTISGWPWRITPDKVFTMAAVGTEAAPAVLQVGTTALVLGPARQSLGEYGNRQKVRIGTGAQAQTFAFTGDGSTRAFLLPFATAQRPAQLYDYDAAAYRNIGIHGVDTLFEWTYRESDNAIVQLAEAPPGTPHDPPDIGELFYTVGWIAQFPHTLTEEDAGEIAARGPWERQPVDAPDIFDLAAGTELAQALIRRYAVWPPPRAIEVLIWTAGFAVGQVATLTDTTRALSGDWLITAMEIRVLNGMALEYRLQLLEGDEQQANFRDFWRRVSGAGGGGSTVTGGIISGGSTPVVTSAYAFDLGGSDNVEVIHTTWVAVPQYRPWVCPLSGTYRCRVQAWTADAGTGVMPRLYDLTAGAAAVTGAATTATTREEQVLSVTAVAGHRYVLQLLPGNTNAGVYVMGGIEA